MPKILLVEDHVPFRESLRDVLQVHFPGVAIAEAGDGPETIRQMDNPSPDVVVMDIRLPGENGLILTKRIKEQYPHVAVFILTNYDTPEYREAAQFYKADRYFLKDTLGTQLVAAIESRLSEVRA